MRTTFVVMMLAASCGGPRSPETPKSYAEHMASADKHERAAATHDRAAAEFTKARPYSYQCGDSVLNDQLTSGTERVTPWVPCWDTDEERAESHRAAADHERGVARSERHAAVELVNAELTACRGISEPERTHSVFAHRKEIAEVVPHFESGQVRGVRVIFKPVAGLTPEWVQKSIACQQAQYAKLGKPDAYAVGDPALVDGATTTVRWNDHHVEVLVVTPDESTGRLALGRAQQLGTGQTATR